MNIAHVIYKMPVHTAGGDASPDTIKAYVRNARHFVNWIEARAKTPDTATPEDARDYVFDCYQQGSKRDTVNQRIAGARAFYRTAIAIGEFAGDNPFDYVKGKISDPDAAQTKYYTPEEVQKIYDTCQTPRDRAIILLMAVEGLRTIEVTRLKVQHVDFQNARIFIHGKGNHDAYIYPAEKTLDTLNTVIGTATTGEIFRNELDGSPLTRDGIRYIVNSILRRAGLKKNGNSCHALRHSCGTNLYAATKDIRLVQETLRHQSPQVTARYSHVVNRKNATSVITPA